MAGQSRKKRVISVIGHSPAFDSCFPLLERLQARGVVEPLILLGPRLRKVEPRAEQAVRAAGVPYVPVSFLRLEVLSALDIMRADAVLTHSDPLIHRHVKFRVRDETIFRTRKPVILVQHGMIQGGLHCRHTEQVIDFYASLMLIWSPLPDPAAPFLATPLTDRLVVCGLTKTNRLAPSPRRTALDEALGRWRQRVLICHSFGMPYPAGGMAAFCARWTEVARRRPDTLFIVRSHRGRRHRAIRDQEAALVSGCDNIILSRRHSGLMRMATINDVLAVVDRVLSHPSTPVLDAIYDDRPVAVFDSGLPEYSLLPHLSCLPTADTVAEIESFLDDPDPLRHAAPLRELYGDIPRNLDVAAEAVERFMADL